MRQQNRSLKKIGYNPFYGVTKIVLPDSVEKFSSEMSFRTGPKLTVYIREGNPIEKKLRETYKHINIEYYD